MAKAPNGKRILNTHIGQSEYRFLKETARREGMTLTMCLRNLIRSEMYRVKSLVKR
jgi:hypothetical protein